LARNGVKSEVTNLSIADFFCRFLTENYGASPTSTNAGIGLCIQRDQVAATD
jgi:hypothetical protein